MPHIIVESVVGLGVQDRKSTRLNSSHGYISYAVFCLKKKKHRYARRFDLSCLENAFTRPPPVYDRRNHNVPCLPHTISLSLYIARTASALPKTRTTLD